MAIESHNILSPEREKLTSQPAVSVVVPNFNYARYLPQRIESVLNQTFGDFEVILLDDASTDNSVEIMRRYADADSRISRIEVNTTNSGSPFLQWERGIALARGQYIWIAEADDFADPAFLEYCIGTLDANSDVVVAFTMSDMCDERSAVIPNHLEKDAVADGNVRIYNGDSYLVSRMQDTNAVFNASMAVFRKPAFEKFEKRIYRDMRWIGDWAFWTEMLLYGNVAHVCRRLNTFRQHVGSTTKISLQNESLINEEHTFDNAFGPIFRSIRYRLLTGVTGKEIIRKTFLRRHIILPLARFLRSFSKNRDVYNGRTPMIIKNFFPDIYSNSRISK